MSLNLIVVKLLLLSCLGFGFSVAARADSGTDPKELERAWLAAKIFVPDSVDAKHSRLLNPNLLQSTDLSGHSVVVYAHGCAGLDKAASDAGVFLARAGFIVLEPDSFARKIKPQSCDPSIPKGGLHRAVLGWRHAEIDFVVKRLKSMEHRAPAHIFLMGLSEGAIATATYNAEPLSGRIIEGWTCHAGWPEYVGLKSPRTEPVLSLVADRDPWFTLPILKGDCGSYMADRINAKSVVFGQGSSLRESHWLTFDKDVKTMVLTFLETSKK